MISIDELEKVLDGKAETEFSRLVRAFNRGVSEVERGKVTVEFSLRMKCLYINGKSYHDYSEESILRLVEALRGEGWPIRKISLFGKFVRAFGGYNVAAYVVTVLPHMEIKRRARQHHSGEGVVADFLVLWGKYPSMRALIFTLLGSVTMLFILAKVASC